MDTPGQPFSVNAPLQHPAVITHVVSMALSIFGCYPLALILGARQHRRYQFYTMAAAFGFAMLALVAGWAAQLATGETATSSSVRILLGILGYTLIVLLLAHACLAVYQKYHPRADSNRILPTYSSLDPELSLWMRMQSPSAQLILGWVILLTGYTYLVFLALVLTESCAASSSSAQCLMPLMMGSGFLGYGSGALLHLLNILSLPRASTPEYYEGAIITLWGAVCLLASDTAILGSNWRALNLGLLWFAGGILSVMVSFQTWMPALRERNIVNALIILLTGRAIITGFTQNDPYTSQIHSTLGYMMIIGSITRIVQIMFRKSPADNLPRLFARTSGSAESGNFTATEDELEDGFPNRAAGYRSAYRQLTGRTPRCKHTTIFASITILSGMLAAFIAMATGIMLMGANVQWVGHVRHYIADPSTYINVTIAVAFLWASYIFLLCTIYKSIRPLSSPYYEYLGLSNMTESDIIPGSNEYEQEAAQRYEERRDLRRARSLPTRRGAENPPAMRPSQYRAKRRSLLIQPQKEQSATVFAKKQRERSSSGFSGVGGVLPDDITTVMSSRKSWLSNGSATSPGSAASFASIGSSVSSTAAGSSSSPPMSSSGLPTETQANHHRRTVLFHDEPASFNVESFQSSTENYVQDEEGVRKTESGRRKERVRKKKGNPSSHRRAASASSSTEYHHRLIDNDDEQDSASSDSHSVAKYYSSERNSSDSHVC